MNYHIGVDIGTGSVKAVAFDGTGEVVGRESVDYSMQHSTPDRSELDPDEVLEGVQASLGRLVNGLLPAMPVMVAFSAAMHSLLAVDNKGRPLTRCMIWADNRAGEIADELRQSDKGKTLYERTGVPIHAMTPLCKLLWLRENEPVIFTAAHKFIGIKEYIFYYLFGEFLVDTPIASATGLLNIHSLTWDEEALSFLGLDPSRLSRLVPPG